LKAQVNLDNVDEELRAFLGLKHHLVGVKLFRRENDVSGSFQPKVPMAFCEMVRRASANGDFFIYGSSYEKCPTARIILGFQDLKYVKNEKRVIPTGTRKVLISSLNEMNSLPDVVLAILTPRQMMDFAVILQAGKNEPLRAEFTGEHACAEFFAKPYAEGEPNMSLLCNGAREIYSDFRDNEIIFGAPLDVYTEAAETIGRINKMGGALCGCRTSDIPTAISNEFEKIGLSKGTDYFFGKIDGWNIRVYLNKDPNGRLKFITIHLPVKTQSEEAAEKLTEKLNRVLQRLYYASKRGYWIDFTVKASEDALGIDLFDGPSIRAAIESFIEKVTPYLPQEQVKRI